MKRNLTMVLFKRAGIIGDSTTLEASYDSLDKVPSQFASLYTEKDGKFVIQVNGLVAQENVQRLESALRKERSDHKGTKEKFSALSALDITPDEIITRLDEYDVLKAGEGAKSGKFTEEEVNARIKAALAPVERNLAAITAERDTLTSSVAEYKEKDTRHNIREQISKLREKVGLRSVAQDDVYRFVREVCEINEQGELVTKENCGVSPYLSLESLLKDCVNDRPHWYESTSGGGATGGKGASGANNPWSESNWNITEQARLIQSNPEQAQALANSAKKPLYNI